MLDYRDLAEVLIHAEKKIQAVSCITDKNPEFNLSMGYKVQNELVTIKRELGHKVIAYKMGLTSPAKMKQMNIHEPIYGYIFDYMNVQNNHIIIEDFIRPKVEAEIAFILGEDIEGPGITGEQVLAKTKWIQPVLEIIDSRYENFKFKLPDVVADNTSASKVVFGNKYFDPLDFEVDSIKVSMIINGELRASGVSSAVLGSPANSAAMLANMLYTDGQRKIEKGSVILTGGITEAVMLKKGDHVITQYESMDTVSLEVR
ncbi:4-oxalocrotonate decarboxylase [Bacillus sp. M6-12]|uniref:2-keto-4-pentenoate hydratase n=1 Tax=Bacillus sp. M6-12 TaxID=2054166 RepID=UPI000C759BC9|nr:fumarylacetoacetate hydrolase family protein [Bacillus sp. M6-12]PLS17415.1 4-oxalocrotonate decarboxylase [Bacillus sp. M6-12]